MPYTKKQIDRLLSNARIAYDSCKGEWGKDYWSNVLYELQKRYNRLN